MRHQLVAVLVLVFFSALPRWFPPSGATAASLPHWTRCELTVKRSAVAWTWCHRYAITHAKGTVVGHWTAVRRISPHVEYWTRFPRFAAPERQVPVQPSGRQVSLSVTAYSWGCGASGDMAHHGLPFVGAAASVDFPAGTVLWVPGWGRVTVWDTGVPSGGLDLFMNSCPQADAWGRQQLWVTVL